MNDGLHLQLSRRERQIMDVIYHLGEASVAEVVERIPDRPSYNTVRNTMAILEKKGHLQHRQDGPRYLFAPRDSVDQAKRSAVSHLLETFFQGSRPKAVLALLGTSEPRLSRDDLAEIAAYIEEARKEVR
jgi:predicted transcriptional regulator